MGNEEILLEIRKNAQINSEASARILGEFVREKDPELLEECNAWLRSRRRIDPAIYLGESLCDLEDVSFEDQRFLVATFGGAAGIISDDLIDRGGFSDPKQVSILIPHSDRPATESGELRLFYLFDNGLQKLLTEGFLAENEGLIRKYNQSQIDCRDLFDASVRRERVIDIRDRVGGYTVLLLHRLLFPYADDFGDIEERYDPSGIPSTKSQGLYNYGAWTNRVDDLWDERKDREVGMRQLVTERAIVWENILRETEEVFRGLACFYDIDRVDIVREKYFSPLIDKSIADKFNI